MKEKVLIIDFGSQYTQLIARKVREINIYCEIHPYHKPPNVDNFGAIILSGSPYSVLEEKAPLIDLDTFNDKPILAICYSAQLIAKIMSCKVSPSFRREYGRAYLKVLKNNPLFKNMPTGNQVWMSHSDTIENSQLPLIPLASTESVENAAYKIKDKPIYGIQFHPEVNHTIYGKQLLENFLIDIAKIETNWTPRNFIAESIESINEIVGKKGNVIIGLSGGVDSSVAAMLISKAIGRRLYCIFVNNGLLRKNEFEEVLESYQSLGLNVKGVHSEKVFLDALQGVSDPEEKRKIIGRIFIEEFEREAQLIDDVNFLAQGTIYPDVIESVSVGGPSVTIKSHHNVGGLPDHLNLKLLEPLKYLFKDEVRQIGSALKIPNKILSRHPFPGPGLAIRMIGNITSEDLTTLREADYIFIEALKKHNYYDKVWQAGAILLPIKTVGVMGDERTYQKCIALRAVESTDGMTADWVHLPYTLLQEISNEIINKVQNINRVVLDISSKPPATIEWE